MGTSKAQVRASLRSVREAMTADAIADADVALTAWMRALPVPVQPGETVAAYVAVGREPGGIALLDALADQGFRVLLPMVPAGPPAPLGWGEYRGDAALTTRRWGLREPGGDPLPPATLLDARLVLLPAVGAGRDGGRLGRGAGYYDRTLAGVVVPTAAVVYDDELLDTVPQDADDIPVDWVLTPSAGFTATRR